MKNVKKIISSVLAAVISLSALGGAVLAQDAELNRSFLMYEDFEDFDIDTKFNFVGKWGGYESLSRSFLFESICYNGRKRRSAYKRNSR